MYKRVLAVTLFVLLFFGKAYAQLQSVHDVAICWGTSEGLTLSLVKKFFIVTKEEAKDIEAMPLYFGTGVNAFGFVLIEVGLEDAGIFFGWNFDKGKGTVGLSLGVLRFPKISNCE
jgi:hypothetical protein